MFGRPIWPSGVRAGRSQIVKRVHRFIKTGICYVFLSFRPSDFTPVRLVYGALLFYHASYERLGRKTSYLRRTLAMNTSLKAFSLTPVATRSKDGSAEHDLGQGCITHREAIGLLSPYVHLQMALGEHIPAASQVRLLLFPHLALDRQVR